MWWLEGSGGRAVGRWVVPDAPREVAKGRWRSTATFEREGSGVGSRHTPGSRLDAREVWWLEGSAEGGEVVRGKCRGRCGG